MEIIKLDPSKQNEYSIKRVNDHSCAHKFIEIDVEERLIKCQKCNTVVDPFNFIYKLATEVENHLSYKNLLEYEVKDLLERKDQLEKTLISLRAKIRRENQ